MENRQECTLAVDIHHPVPFFLGGSLEWCRIGAYTGAVIQNVYLPEFLYRLLDRFLYLGAVRNIAMQENRIPALCLDISHRLFAFLVQHIDDHRITAFIGVPQCDRPAHSTGTSGNKRYFILQYHQLPPSKMLLLFIINPSWSVPPGNHRS